MAAAPENDILTRLNDIENAIMPILEDLREDNVPFDDVHREIDEVRVMIQHIIDGQDEHQVILGDMIDAVAAAELAVNPRLDRSENDAIMALNDVIALMEDLRSQHVGGYRKRKRRTHRKRRTQRKRNRRRTHRNRK
jgi:hypothetical protein